MNYSLDTLEKIRGENEAADMRRNYEVRGQRIRELEALLSECLDYPAGVNCCRLEQKIAKALGRKVS